MGYQPTNPLAVRPIRPACHFLSPPINSADIVLLLAHMRPPFECRRLRAAYVGLNWGDCNNVRGLLHPRHDSWEKPRVRFTLTNYPGHRLQNLASERETSVYCPLDLPGSFTRQNLRHDTGAADACHLDAYAYLSSYAGVPAVDACISAGSLYKTACLYRMQFTND
ncbi:unnamed protein product [Dibothriocephalus latus]|uniref:Uncharacterized protein n=1 Tax=Dibothriocephalus latus TaxID=60516 RepID=A0A3P6SJ76_DIBLA|nr:unnamed protein product [Dibothriocephalus latus]